MPAVARQLVGEVLRVTGANDLPAGLVPETPGRKGDRGKERLQVARRRVDDQPPDMAIADRFQFRGDDLVMPAQRELGPRVEFAETVLHEAGKISPEHASYWPGIWVSAVVIALSECRKMFSNIEHRHSGCTRAKATRERGIRVEIHKPLMQMDFRFRARERIGRGALSKRCIGVVACFETRPLIMRSRRSPCLEGGAPQHEGNH
jgi:hypothetical protein